MASFLKCSLPTCFGYAGNLAFVSVFTEADTAQTELTHISMGTAADFAAIVMTNREFRFFIPFSIKAFLAKIISSLLMLRICCEGHAEETQQFACFFIGLGSGDDDDIHALDLIDLVVFDFRENQLFLQPNA